MNTRDAALEDRNFRPAAALISISMGSALAAENMADSAAGGTLMIAEVSDITATDTSNEDSLPSSTLPEDPKPPAPVTVKTKDDGVGTTSMDGRTDKIGAKTIRRVLDEFVDKNFRPKITNSISRGPLLGERTTAVSNPV